MEFRRATAKDLEFVLDSWSRSYRMSHTAGPIPVSMYQEVYGRVLGELITRLGVEVTVAVFPAEAPPMDVAGWVCVEHDAVAPVRVYEGGRWSERLEPLSQPLVHYINVKRDFRGHGVARALLHHVGVNVTRPFYYDFQTALVTKIRRRIPGWAGTFDPRLSRFPKTNPKEMLDGERTVEQGEA